MAQAYDAKKVTRKDAAGVILYTAEKSHMDATRKLFQCLVVIWLYQ